MMKQTFLFDNDYKIIKMNTLEELQSTVEAYIERGYMPLGGPFETSSFFCQAVFRGPNLYGFQFDQAGNLRVVVWNRDTGQDEEITEVKRPDTE